MIINFDFEIRLGLHKIRIHIFIDVERHNLYKNQ